MTDFTSRMNTIHEHNFGGNGIQNSSYIYNNSNNCNNVYYNTTTYNNNITSTTCNGINIYRANNISLSFSQQHCKISG